MQSRFRFLINPNFLIPAAALLLRFIYLLHIQSSPYFASPELDSKMHDLWAQQIVAGEFANHEPFFRAPLYYYFLAFIYYLFGHNYLIPRLIQICLGAFAAWLTYRLGRRIYGENAGIIAGFIYACCGPLIYFDAELRIPALLLPLLLLTLLQLDRQRAKPTMKGFLLAGALLGLSALARPNILIFVPFIWFWIISILRGKWQHILSITLGAIFLIAPVTLRNFFVGHDVVLVGSQAGVNYYIGNNPQSDGYTAIVPGTPGDWEGGYRETIRIAEEAAGKELKPSQVSRYWFKRSLAEMTADIPRWIGLTWHKTRLLVSGHEIGNNDDIYFNRRFSWLLGLLMWEKGLAFPFGLLMPFGLFSLLLIFNWKRDSLLLLFFVSYAAGIIAFFVCTRFRLPLIPILAVWSGAGIVRLFTVFKEKKLHRYALQMAILVALLITLNINPLAGVGRENFEGAYYLGGKYLEQGKVDQALAAYREAVTIDPTSARARNGLAMTFLRQRNRAEAKHHLLAAVMTRPGYIQARNNLALVYQQEGNLDSALVQFQAVIGLDSLDSFAQRGIADLANDRGDFQIAAEHYQAAYKSGVQDKQLMSRWANALMQLGDLKGALSVNRILLQSQPQDTRILLNQARLLFAADSLDAAVTQLQTILRIDPGNQNAQQLLNDLENP